MAACAEKDEYTETREALFRVRHAITELEKAAKEILTLDEACKITTRGPEVFLANRREMGDNFKRVILEELSATIDRLSAVRSRLENI